MQTINNHFKAYQKLVRSIDVMTKSLASRHDKYLNCKKGCDLCCMDYSVLPVEYHFLESKINLQKGTAANKKRNSSKNGCVFLQDHECTIYKDRPVICRTHGLPLLFINDDYEWELSTCELNFQDYDYELFTSDNTFPQDKINSSLFMLNKAFIKNWESKSYGEFDRIPLRNLLNTSMDEKDV